MRRVLVACVLTLLATACTSDPADPADPGAEKPSTNPTEAPVEIAPATLAWTKDVDVAMQPVRAGGSAVLYTVEGEELYAMSVEASTGTRQWKRAATPSLTLSGVSPSMPTVEVDGREVVTFLERDPSGPALRGNLVAVDAATGEEVAKANGWFFTSWPTECPGAEGVCVKAKLDSGTEVQAQWRRLSLRDGTFKKTRALPAGSRILNDDVVDLGSRDPEYLARVQDGEPVWKVDVDDAYPPGSSSDTGWTLRKDSEAGVVFGWIGGPTSTGPGGATEIDLAASGFAGLDVESGEVLWKRAGYGVCLSIDAPLDQGDAVLPVRCEQSGIVRFVENGTKAIKTRRTLEGFDPRSGETTWRQRILLEARPGTPDLAYAGETEVVVRTPAGPQVLDLVSGEARSPEQGEIFLCATEGIYDFEEPVFYSGTPSTSHVRGVRYEACNARFKSQSASSTDDAMSGLISRLSGTPGDSVAIATTEELRGYDVP